MLPILDIKPNKLSKLPIVVGTDISRQGPTLHFHNFTQICYTKAGKCLHTVEGKARRQHPGDFVFVFPYTLHTLDTTASDPTPLQIMFSFPDRFLTDRGYDYFSYDRRFTHFEGMKIPSFVNFRDKDKEKADELIGKITGEFFKKRNMSYDVIATYLAEFLAFSCERAPSGGAPSYLTDARRRRAMSISRTVSYIANHHKEKISVDELAAVADMTRNTFFRNFEEITGMTAVDFITIQRLRSATLLLALTDKTLDEIAKEVGFYDDARLSHAFVGKFGILPSEYKRRHKPTGALAKADMKVQWGWLENLENIDS